MGINLDENHRDITGGWLRPAVFGAMDGLVSNLALMVGVAGGSAAAGASTNQAVILAGIAGLLAGAFSMAAGEYTSVESQSELAEAEVAKELAAIKNHPEQEIQELAKMFEKQGMSSETALLAASEVSQDESRRWPCILVLNLGLMLIIYQAERLPGSLHLCHLQLVRSFLYCLMFLGLPALFPR